MNLSSFEWWREKKNGWNRFEEIWVKYLSFFFAGPFFSRLDPIGLLLGFSNMDRYGVDVLSLCVKTKTIQSSSKKHRNRFDKADR